MADIKAADVAKLRKATGAGMMDCKKALQESNGDFDAAVEIIRKKGQAIANKRSEREASEGAVLAGTTADSKFAAIVVLNCETDFVAKNEDFVGLTQSILNVALDKKPASLDNLKKENLEGKTVEELVVEKMGVTGEKLELSAYEKVEGEMTIFYIHPGNRLATVVAFNKHIEDGQVGKDIAMQIAAMNPVAIDREDVPADVVEKEKEIGREQARQEGKPDNLLDRIAEGKLNKFFKESTLINQDFIKDGKMTVKQYLQNVDKELKVVDFKRYSLAD